MRGGKSWAITMLEWACKVLNSVCITVDKILNISCCWLIHQQCWASQLGASQGLQSTWEGYKTCRVWSTPGACPGAASLWNNRTSCVGVADATGSAGGFWGRAMWQPWKGTSVHRVRVSHTQGGVLCCWLCLSWPCIRRALVLVTRSILLEWRWLQLSCCCGTLLFAWT